MVKIKERDTRTSVQVEDKVLLGTIYALSKRIGMSVNALRGLFILFGIFNMGYSIVVYIVATVLVGNKLQESQDTQEPQDSYTSLGSLLKDSMGIDISGNTTTESKPKQTMVVDDLQTLDEDEAYHPLSGVGSEEADVTDPVKDEPSVSVGFATIRDELGSNNLDGLVETDTSDVWDDESSIDELGSDNLDGLVETGTSEILDDESNIDDIWGSKTKTIWDEEKTNIWE